MLADLLPGYSIFCSVKACQGFGGGSWVAIGGTSAASPLFAGGVVLVDQLLRQDGKQSLGLANSLFYKIDRRYGADNVFNDIQTGSNDLGAYIPGGNRRALGCCSAGPGYDLASGLGSPNLDKLALIAVALQPPIASIGLSLPAQRPIARRRLVVRVSCSRRCLFTTPARITIQGEKPMSIGASRQLLLRAGHRTVTLAFSRSQVGRLRSARDHHRRTDASVVAEVLDPGGTVEAVSHTRTLRIRH